MIWKAAYRLFNRIVLQQQKAKRDDHLSQTHRALALLSRRIEPPSRDLIRRFARRCCRMIPHRSQACAKLEVPRPLLPEFP
jgi:hypothetical protein